jgi:hypothetical protein
MLKVERQIFDATERLFAIRTVRSTMVGVKI